MRFEMDEVEPKKCKCGAVLVVKCSNGESCQAVQKEPKPEFSLFGDSWGDEPEKGDK